MAHSLSVFKAFLGWWMTRLCNWIDSHYKAIMIGSMFMELGLLLAITVIDLLMLLR